MKTNNMQVEGRTLLNRVDWNFALVIFALNVIGLINLYSATHGVHVTGTSSLFWKQIFWLTAGWIVYFLVTLVDYRIFIRFAYAFYALNLSALLAVMFFGKSFYGAQRWLDLGLFRYQPSETMKFVMIMVLAKILASKKVQDGLGFRDLALPGALTLLPFGLTVKQPDLGTAILIAAIAASMIFFVRVKKTILISGLLIGVVTAPLIWNFGLKPYQKNRILTFVSPGRDPRGTGYNSIQSKIAVGSGKVWGKGFRKGTQSQLEFLPERHTDFIFSVLSEEHGFIGSIFTVSLFMVLYLMAIRIASEARDRFGSLIVVGVLSYLFWHMFVNMSMVIGLLPIVGVPLPLLSYGGSSLVATMAGLGLVSSVAYRRYLF